MKTYRSLLLAGVLLAGFSAPASALGPGYGWAPAPPAPYAGPVNHAHAHAHQSFRWGWFGAEDFRPLPRWHRGYYGQHYRWTRQR